MSAEAFLSIPYAVFTVTGPDALMFLQGQFCNDLLSLKIGDIQINAWCSIKGRVTESFFIFRTNEEEYALIVPIVLSLSFLASLKKFIFRSKVVLTQHPQKIGICFNPAQNNSYTQLGYCSLIPEITWCLTDEDLEPASWWSSLLIKKGIMLIDAPELQDQFLPQMLNYDLLSIISWNKGCYRGQEIIARTHYQGLLKKRMQYLLSSTPHCFTALTSLHHSASSRSGSVLKNEGYDMLAMIPHYESCLQGYYYVNQSDRLIIQTLPYNLPSPITDN